MSYATILERAAELLSTPDFTGITVQVGRPVNQNVNLCPWIGIYAAPAIYDPMTLGGAENMDAEISVDFIIQVVGGEQAIQTEQRMDEIIAKVFSAVKSSQVWKGTITMVTGFETNPGVRPVGDGGANFRETVVTLKGTLINQ